MSWRFVVWLDRDGTLVDDPGYLDDPEALVLLPHAAQAVKLLRDAGGFVALITNQSGIARGYMSRGTVDRIHDRLREQLREGGADLDAVYLCPHLPADLAGDDACDCRKPKPGMVQQALAENPLQGLPSFGIGDKLADVGLARAVGAKALLLRSGEGRQAEQALGALRPDGIFDDVLDAARWVVDEVDSR